MKFTPKLHLPYSGQLVHTDVRKTIRKEQKRLAELAKKPQTVIQIKRKKI